MCLNLIGFFVMLIVLVFSKKDSDVRKSSSINMMTFPTGDLYTCLNTLPNFPSIL